MYRVFQLEYNVNKKKLKEVFRLAGKIQRVDLSIDKDGKSRGFGIVEYDHPVEAVQAISMFNNQLLYDRALTVRMDREGPHTHRLPEGLKNIGMGLGSNGEPLKDVARNLPSITSNPPQPQAGGTGILGAVPNAGLGLNLNNALGASGLGGLGGNAAALQAAALGGLSTNLLANSLGGADLANLVQNQGLAALAGAAAGSNQGSGFSRNDNSAGLGLSNSFGGGNRSFDDSKSGGRGFGYSDRPGNLFTSPSNGQMRSQVKREFGNSKVLISNVSRL